MFYCFVSIQKNIENEKDPEVLRKLIYSQREIIGLQDKIIERLNEQKRKEDQERLFLEDQLAKFKKRMFGKSSEQESSSRKRDEDDSQLTLHSQSLAPEPKALELKKIPEIRVNCELSPEELSNIAETYGYPRNSEWELIKGLYDESSEYDLVPKEVVKKRYYRFKYRLKESKGTEKEIIVSASGPLKLVPGSSYSIDFALDIVSEKYLYHTPLERQRRKFEAMGLEISTKTLYSLTYFICMHLEEVYELIRQQILLCGLTVHLD